MSAPTPNHNEPLAKKPPPPHDRTHPNGVINTNTNANSGDDNRSVRHWHLVDLMDMNLLRLRQKKLVIATQLKHVDELITRVILAKKQVEESLLSKTNRASIPKKRRKKDLTQKDLTQKGERTPKKTKRCQKSSPALPSSLINQQQKPQAPLPANNNNGKDNAIDICRGDQSWEEPQAKEPSEDKKNSIRVRLKAAQGSTEKGHF